MSDLTRKSFLAGGMSFAAGSVGMALARSCFATDGVVQAMPNVDFKDLQTVNLRLGGGRVFALSSRVDSISLSTVFVSPEGKILVVDGGQYRDGPFLSEFLRALGGHVDYWFVTHAHADHYGALVSMAEECTGNGGVSIGELIFDFPERAWLESKEPDIKPNLGRFYKDITDGGLKDVKRGDCSPGRIVKFGSWTFEILNAPFRWNEDPVNNSSVMLSVSAGGKTWLETGDMAVAGGCDAVKKLGNRLKHDIVFLAHHGQDGVDKDFYAAVAPEAAVWPTPSWLWDNRDRKANGTPGSGPYLTNYTKCWMQDLGVKRNYVLLKDYLFE